MTRKTKKLIAILAVLFMACVCCGGIALVSAWSLNRAFVTEPDKAKALGQEIADYTLPEGYSEVFGMQLMGMELVAIAKNLNTPSSMLIMMMKVPDTGNIDQTVLEKQIESTLQRQLSFQQLDLTLDDVETRTVNGEEVALTFCKGTDAAGADYRQMSTLFHSSKGQVLMVVQGTKAEWDQAALDAILDSIR